MKRNWHIMVSLSGGVTQAIKKFSFAHLYRPHTLALIRSYHLRCVATQSF